MHLFAQYAYAAADEFNMLRKGSTRHPRIMAVAHYKLLERDEPSWRRKRSNWSILRQAATCKNSVTHAPNSTVVSGLLLGLLFVCNRPTPARIPRTECPVPLPLDPIIDHRLPLNDPRLRSLRKELSETLEHQLDGINSAVVIVVHGGENIVEWSHGRIRSNVTEKEDNRKVGPETIWRVASITKVQKM